MSHSDDTTEDFKRRTGTDMRSALGVLRRMAIRVTSGSFWQAVGVLLLDQSTRETLDAEPFSGVGFYARPRQGANVEAIVGAVGGPENPVILASRDEDTRKKMALLDQDETAVYNTQVTLVMKKNGTIEARTAAGVAVALCTLADAQAIRNALNNHTHTYLPGSGGATVTTGNPAVPAPTGTTVFKAQ